MLFQPHHQLAAYTLVKMYNGGVTPEISFDQKTMEFKVDGSKLDPRVIQDWMLTNEEMELLQQAVLKPQHIFFVIGDKVFASGKLESTTLGSPAHLAFTNLVSFNTVELAHKALALAKKLWAILNPIATRPSVEIKMFKTHPDAKEPRVAYDGTSAAFDIASVKDVVIPPYTDQIVPVGIKFSIDQNDPFYMQIHMRSSFGFKHGVQCHQGIVDSGYCGDFGVKVFNRTSFPISINKGEYFAQVIVLEKPKFKFKELNEQEWNEYEQRQIRGSGGFGSSGKC